MEPQPRHSPRRAAGPPALACRRFRRSFSFLPCLVMSFTATVCRLPARRARQTCVAWAQATAPLATAAQRGRQPGMPPRTETAALHAAQPRAAACRAQRQQPGRACSCDGSLSCLPAPAMPPRRPRQRRRSTQQPSPAPTRLAKATLSHKLQQLVLADAVGLRHGWLAGLDQLDQLPLAVLRVASGSLLLAAAGPDQPALLP